MKNSELIERIKDLPKGGLTVKVIKGKPYTYYQWTEDGKQKSRTVSEEEKQYLAEKIEERKLLQKKLRSLETGVLVHTEVENEYKTNIRVGGVLKEFASSVKDYKKRSAYKELEEYVFGNSHDKVFVLYGLRRTGKTTLIRQIIWNMKEEELEKAVFIQINASNTLSDINQDLKRLESRGYRYIFVDEVTLMQDFIEGAALFSDVYASSGMKIVLSGTDSLGFVFTEDEQLYDRCILLHTTFIPFKEFERVLGIRDIDEYIKYGGTMSRSGDNYNKSIFATKKGTDEYVNTAIARNIQHSLKNYQHEGHFRALKDLYDKNELTNVINRIVEDMNHEFTLKILKQDFKSHDLGSARNVIRKDRNNPTDILDQLDTDKQTVEIKDIHREEIKEYLQLLDVIYDIPLVDMKSLRDSSYFTVFSQPGLRYSQAESLIKTLMMDELFSGIEATERKRITERILDEIKGRMLEEIVQLETAKARKGKEVFKLQFADGEFDMVVYNPEAVCCEIYEIKNSKEINPNQYRHLLDDEKCAQTEFRYGKILSKTVLYRGEEAFVNAGVMFRNVEEYLMAL